MEKPILEWLKEIPDLGIRHRAIVNYVHMPPPYANSSPLVSSMQDALDNAFKWSKSPEGYRYWMLAHKSLGFETTP